VTWNDLYWGTNGPRSRAGTNVNVDAASVVSYVSDGEWLSYSVNAAAAGVYSVSYSLSAAPPTTVPITVFLTREASCAGAQTGLFSSPAFSTGSYTTFKDSLATSTITLPAGVSLVRVCWVRASYLQFASFTITSTGSSPFEGIPAAVPGTISAGRFDVGGQGVAYNEVVVAGQPRIRANELVTGDALGLGYTTNGEWTRYSVKIATAGNYKVEYLLAGDTGPVAVAIKLVLNGDCATGAALAPYTSASFKTGSWTAAQPFAAAANAVLPAGDHRLTLCLDTIAGVNVMGVRITAAAAPTPAPTRKYCVRHNTAA
jgi:Carbohydrate binding module (family 6)